MKTTVIMTIMLLMLSLEAFAQRNNEFAGIPFGASRQTVIEEILKMGYEPFGQSGEGERIVIPVYMFGELPVKVDFLFNKNDKFYSFEIRTGRVEQARLGKAFEAVSYMSEQFTLKYGKSSGVPTITESSALKDGGIHNVYQNWYGVKTLDAHTAVVQIDNRFFAVGVVVHRKLADEKSVSKKVEKVKSVGPVF